MKNISIVKILTVVFLGLFALSANAQDKDLGDKEYVIIKDYKPVLAESNKISDSPEGDTAYSNPPKMDYTISPKILETNFEAGVIRAVKIKEEPIQKLYRSLAKLGIGSYRRICLHYGNVTIVTLGEVPVEKSHFKGISHRLSSAFALCRVCASGIIIEKIQDSPNESN